MKAIQREIGLTAVAGTPVSKPVAKGRPRRLAIRFKKLTGKQWAEAIRKIEEGEPKEKVFSSYQIRPAIIKVGIKPEHADRLEAICNRLEGGCTQPDIIRMCVTDYIEKHKDQIESGQQVVDLPQKRTIVKGRCPYVKVPFTQDAILAIEKLKSIYNATRQQVINKAVEEFLETI